MQTDREQAPGGLACGDMPGSVRVSAPSEIDGAAAGTGRFGMRRVSTRLQLGLVLGLLALHFGLAVSSVRTKSAAYDEVFDLTRGYSFWMTGDFRVAPPHPPLPALLATLPPVAARAELPPLDSKLWVETRSHQLAWSFFYSSGNDVMRMLTRARSMIAALSVVLGLGIFIVSRHLFGVAGGLVSLTVYTFSPTLLAHARLVTTDFTVSAFFLFTVAFTWWAFHRISPVSLTLCSLSLAGLFTSKLTSILVLPMVAAMLLLRMLSRRPTRVALFRCRGLLRSPRHKMAGLAVVLAVQGVVTFAGIWAVYGFRYSAFHTAVTGNERFVLNAQERFEDPWPYLCESQPVVGTCVRLCRRMKLFPELYLYSIAMAGKQAQRRVAFLNGEHALKGFSAFFPYCFLYKTPLPLLLLLGCALVGCVAAWRKSAGASRRRTLEFWRRVAHGAYRTAPFWLLLVVYWATAFRSHLNIGNRHILPTHPPLVVLAGASACLLRHRSRLTRGLVPVLLLCFAIGSLSVYPHYLSYFNLIAGGPRNGHKHLVDSSLDWGQDLLNLKLWLDRNATDDEPVFLSYFGNAPPSYYGIKARTLPFDSAEKRTLIEGGNTPVGGVYCISATNLQQLYPPVPFGGWTKERETAYWQLKPQMTRVEELGPELFLSIQPEARAAWPKVQEQLRLFRQLRFGKLCHSLRQREPDDYVGYSILIYRLSDEDVARILSTKLEFGASR